MPVRNRWRPSPAFILLALALAPVSLAGQGTGGGAYGGIRLTATAGISFREGPDGFRVGRDARAAALRVQVVRSASFHPWLEVGAFQRPDLDCVAHPDGLPCNDDGWTLRAGASLPFASDDRRQSGLAGELLAGAGVGLSQERALSYLLGIEVQWLVSRRVAPSFSIRWERFPGLTNVVMGTAGLRLDLF